MLEHNPVDFLKKEGVTKAQLSAIAKRSFTVYEKMKANHEKFPDSEEIEKNTNKSGANLMAILEKEVAQIKGTTNARSEEAARKKETRSKSMTVVKKTKAVIVDLKACKKMIKDERKRKMDAGEITPPVKKSRVVKVQEAAARILKLMPSKDADVIKASETAIRECCQALFKLNGLTQIVPLKKKLKEESAKMVKDAAKAAKTTQKKAA